MMTHPELTNWMAKNLKKNEIKKWKTPKWCQKNMFIFFIFLPILFQKNIQNAYFGRREQSGGEGAPKCYFLDFTKNSY